MQTTARPNRSSADPRASAVAVIQSLRKNYERWAQRCYRIRDKHGRIRPLSLNPVQRAIGRVEAEQLRNRGQCRIFVLKARQGGVSTDQQARAW
jgi:hypothetical protein